MRPISRRAANLGSRSGFWAAVYYCVLQNSFAREQMAFLAGRCAYQKSLRSPDGSMAVLRRNAHRLEKALLMRPRRVPFALKYIGETVNAFSVAAEKNCIDPDERAWAEDVLCEYFAVHEGDPSVDHLRQVFNRAASSSPNCNGSRRIPYLRDLSQPPSVSFNAFWELAKRRRSVRWFLQQPVEREAIDRAIEVGSQAPSACNRQPFQFRIFDDPAVVQQVIQIPYGLAGYGHNVPVVAVVIGQQRHFFNERDRHLIYIDASLAVMGFLYGLEVQGISSCCVNWPDIPENEEKMARLLKLDPDERPIMLVAIGYPDPDGMVANSTKKSLAQLRCYNFE